MSIRYATPADATRLSEIARAAYKIYLARMDRRPAPMDAEFSHHIENDTVYVFEESGEVKGYAVVTDCPDMPMLENIAIDPSAQGQGIGQQLITTLEADFQARGVSRYKLYTNAVMHENLSYYPKLGFIEVDRRLENGFHRVYFEKQLTASK